MCGPADGRPDAAGLDGAGRGDWPAAGRAGRRGIGTAARAAAVALARDLLVVWAARGRLVRALRALVPQPAGGEAAVSTPAELALIRSAGDCRGAVTAAAARSVPWLTLACPVASRNLWLLCLMYACQSYGWYFYMTYLPSFLEDQYGVHKREHAGGDLQGRAAVDGRRRLPDGRAADRLVRPPHRQPSPGPAAVRCARPRADRRLLPALPLHAQRAFWFFVVISLVGLLHRSDDGRRPGPSARTSAGAMRRSWPGR